MEKANADIRAAAKEAGVYLYSIAFKMGVSENTLTRLLRRELPAAKKSELLQIVEEIRAEKQKTPIERR